MSLKTPKLYDINASQFLLCLFENYHEGVFITDQNGILVYYNRALARIDGLDHRQVLGRAVTEIYHLDASQSTAMLALRLARPIINRHHVYRAVDGKLVNSISSAYPLFDSNTLVGAVCTVTDYSSLVGNLPQSPVKAPERRESRPGNSAETVSFDDLIGHNETMRAAVDMARRAAATPSSIMLIGETGTGKELFARAIHHSGPRRTGPFLAINCAAIPGTLLEAVLFGTAKGAFTGAVDKAGLFELANAGVLFLDEVSSMPIELQSKLLRVLQERRVRRVGSSLETPIDIKIISAVNESPFKAIEQGLMRADLFYRLGVVIIPLPPLRERRDDIQPLLNHFMKKFNRVLDRQVLSFSPKAGRALSTYSWPGNVRELEHAVEAAMNIIDPTETVIGLEHLQTALALANFGGAQPAGRDQAGRLSPAPERPEPEPPGGIDDFKTESARLTEALRRSRGNVARAARSLGFSPQRLHYRLKKLGLSCADYKY
ncbi:MAG: sigma 54-interacting transcriptional regulator [Candidatus Adiutrix sp.]|jgi:arginine utilization regulatory protein|nr:sigma 54-interacting transcriptional regulator [Candidatus Adiutrix sp.]